MVLFVLAVNKGLCTTFRTVLVEMAFVHELFPAHAGVIPRSSLGFMPLLTFPRPRGGDPTAKETKNWEEAFSPPTRG